jgi:hypothetical protein
MDVKVWTKAFLLDMGDELGNEFDFRSIQSVSRKHLRHSSIEFLDSNHVDLNQSDGDRYVEFTLFISSVHVYHMGKLTESSA